jgi:2-C-methyl-D-erythritol 4-phosphate cytidylyltransferase
MRYWLVMPAAGAGQRFAGRQSAGRQSGGPKSGAPLPKQYAPLGGRTVIEWALAPFLADPRCAGAVVALAPGDTWWPKVAERIPAVTVAPGGGERSESVRNALAALNRRAGKDDWVLVHDAARPCLPSADLDRLLERVAEHPLGGILALPVADTLKRANADTAIDQTVDRAGLWRAGTPQMFRYGVLVDALDRAIAARRFPTDEAQALEWLGQHPLLVEGSAANIKVTTPDDLALAEALLASREGQAAGREGKGK